MSLVRSALAGLALLSLAGAWSPAAHAQDERLSQVAAVAWAPETFTLDNGLQVVVLPDHRAPVVTHMVWYRVGAADEPPGKSGVAHFLEHLMFKGTEKVPPGEFSKIVSRNGGVDNAFTSQDYTAYFQRVARDRLELVMRLEADRMNNLRLVDGEVYPERDVVLEERRLRIDNNPTAQLAEQMAMELYEDHPYGVPIIGWMSEVSQLTRQDAVDFYSRHYAPDNAILVVAGDITADELKPLARKYFGRIPPEQLAARTRPEVGPPPGAKRLTLEDPRVKEPTWLRYYRAPSYATAAPGEAEAVSVLAQILGGGATSRLYQRLVMDKKVASAAGASYDGDALGPTRLTVYGGPAQGKSLKKLEKNIDQVIADIVKTGVETDELERAKSSLIAAATYALDSQESMAQIYGTSLTTGSSIADVVEWPERIAAVSAEDVQRAAEKVLIAEASVTGIVLPEGWR